MKNIIYRLFLPLVLLAATLPAANGQSRDLKLGKNIEILMNVFRDLTLFYVDEVDTDEMLRNAAYGISVGLDPYTEFLPEEDMADFEVMTTGKYGGIGSLIRQNGDWVHIAQPYKDSPADRAGLVIGDKILAVEGTSAEAIGSAKVSSMMKGDPGTVLKMTVEKFFTGEVEELEILRERISISGVPYYGFLNDSIGYIKHSDFTEHSSSDMRTALMELRKTGRLKGLVLDYRSNGGGILQEAVKILSMFVPKGTEVVSMRGKISETNVVFRTETDPVDLETPIVVLTNGGSASAAEIVAGALQDLDRAVLIGQRTYGKGLVQSTRPVGYNSYMKITTAKYYMPSGRCIQAIDYAQRDDDGSVTSIPDSLITQYATAGGRKVYDGGGIMPDIRLEPEYISRYAVVTYGLGYIDDFSDLYVKKYNTPVVPGEFALSDDDYRWFMDFMSDKEMEYQSETAAALRNFIEKARKERYYDLISADIEDMKTKLADERNADLLLYKDQLTGLIEDNIVLRYNYQDGVIRHGLTKDSEVESAVSLLSDIARYNEILREKDTDRK